MPAITQREAQEQRQQRERDEIRDEALRGEMPGAVGLGGFAPVAYVDAGDATNAGLIAAEAGARAGADTTLAAAIVTEAAARVTGDAATLSSANTYADGKVIDSIADGDTTHAPSRNAVFDALAGKQPTGDYVTFADLSEFDAKPAVAYCSTSALPACTYANGASGVGATLTATANGPLVIDGVTVAVAGAGQRVLIAGQASSFQNGWYTITQVGVLAVSPFILTRTTQSDQSTEIRSGYLTAVTPPSGLTAGSTNNGKVFISIAPTAFVVGTDALIFAPVGTAGITDLTGDVTASGSGSVAATLATAQPGAHTWAQTQTFTVAPIVPTQSPLDNSTKAASTAYVDAAVTAGGGGGGSGLSIGLASQLSNIPFFL